MAYIFIAMHEQRKIDILELTNRAIKRLLWIVKHGFLFRLGADRMFTFESAV